MWPAGESCPRCRLRGAIPTLLINARHSAGTCGNERRERCGVRDVRVGILMTPARTSRCGQGHVLLSQASPATRALQEATRTIPIVFVGVADPIGSGFVASLANPGGHTTGFLLFEASITAKWLAMRRSRAEITFRCDADHKRTLFIA